MSHCKLGLLCLEVGSIKIIIVNLFLLLLLTLFYLCSAKLYINLIISWKTAPPPWPPPSGLVHAGLSPKKSTLVIKEWRLRLHQARRRVCLQVLIVVRLLMSVHTPPRKFRTLGFQLPLVLREYLQAFVAEQQMYLSLQAELELYRVGIHLGGYAFCPP